MEWRDDGIVLSVAQHGESGAVLEVMTRSHGRARGYVRGGNSRKQRPVLQPGNHLALVWRSRLAESLGQFTVDPARSPLGAILSSGGKLKAMACLLSVVATSTAEGEPQTPVYDSLSAILDLIADTQDPVGWAAAVVRLEAALLAHLGYGLDLAVCAATGREDNLVYVSPKTGRAVSRSAGDPWKEKLLPLPAFLTQQTAPSQDQVIDGFALTGYFLERQIWVARRSGAPDARARFVDYLRQLAPQK